jgi:Fe-S oxidoreductase
MDEQYLYHAPCHDPIKSNDSAAVIAKIMNSEVISNDRCCGEAGTFAVARPDITSFLWIATAQIPGRQDIFDPLMMEWGDGG